MGIGPDSHETEIIQNNVEYDNFSYSAVSGFYESYYREKLFDSRSDEFATIRLRELRESWRSSQEHPLVVFTSGVFDLMHHDHKGYLLHTKLTALPDYYKRTSGGFFTETWEGLKPEQQAAVAEEALALDSIKLIVSVDGDNSVMARKGKTSEKGNSPRPITGWETRAKSVADTTVPVPTINGMQQKPVVDAVTIHGTKDLPADIPNHSIEDLVTYLQPDIWAVYEESQDILSMAPHIPELGKVALRCISKGEGVTYFKDTFLGRFSTSALVKRAKGEI